MLEFKNFSKSYVPGKYAVKNLSLKIEDGDIYGFIGHNGAGKSTAIKALVGALDFTEGDILIDGVSIKKDPAECKKNIAYIPDNPDMYEYMTGAQYLNFIADIFRMSKDKTYLMIKKYADIFDMEGNLGDLVSSYSHGMKQKLALISALIHEPKTIIMDEPFVGLDPLATYKVKEIMREKCAEGGAIFFSTHVLEVAEKLCNKIAIIKNGELIAAGAHEEIIGDKSLEDVFLGLVEK